jgi:adenosylhomocysteinase
VVVCGYGDVGKVLLLLLEVLDLLLQLLKSIHLCYKLQWMKLKKLNTVVGNADIVITTTGNKDIVLGSHFEQMKDKTIVCNMGILIMKSVLG